MWNISFVELTIKKVFALELFVFEVIGLKIASSAIAR